MDPLLYFMSAIFSLALIYSMVYNPRRLETIGYALSILFLQQLIADNEDIFLICSQFPLYVSPRDEGLSPDVTMPDSAARGVYVDHALLLPRASQNAGNLNLLQVLRNAFSTRNHNVYRSLHITTLEVPLLEEKKRAPTRHPRDLEAHISSIQAALDDAQSQVTTQARILFSSPRFVTQDQVVLVASSGEYYRLAVLSRGHRALSTVPSNDEILDLLINQVENTNLVNVAENLKSELVISARTPTERERQRRFAEQKAEKEEIEKQKNAREARALSRNSRRAALSREPDLVRRLSQIVIDAGEPEPFYSDDWIEAYHKMDKKIKEGRQSHHLFHFQRYPTFFEPEPQPHEGLSTLANLRNPKDDRRIVFTGAIRIGSATSEKFSQMIRQYLYGLAREERSRRQSAI